MPRARAGQRPPAPPKAVALPQGDPWLLGAALILLVLGLVMVSSASLNIAERQYGHPFYYAVRQLAFVIVGVIAALLVMRTRLVHWEKAGGTLLLAGMVLLALVLVPGIGKVINGSQRWLPLGLFNLQASEPVKLFVVVYIAGYLVRHGAEVRTSIIGFLKPMLLLVLIGLLLLLEPDFGATAVMFATALGMLFLGGARLWPFVVLMAVVAAGVVGLIYSSPYRMARLTGFLDPWADPFDTGFQLTQALIAFGRGEWFGVGLGASVQKLFYLPEAHTDFLFAVLAEELGLLGSLAVIGLFALIVARAYVIGRTAEKGRHRFAAYLAYGLGLWIGLQAVINIGVNMGMLPTKGLTLPLMSYGGSSIVVMCVAVALLLRIAHETRVPSSEFRAASPGLRLAEGKPR
ncbi:MAG: putative lipid II flippase FtsW [Gammaproteobacteria bacterium]|nr:putative lipid II flippase FtsW [Gammaproteobacteria bacterium]